MIVMGNLNAKVFPDNKSIVPVMGSRLQVQLSFNLPASCKQSD